MIEITPQFTTATGKRVDFAQDLLYTDKCLSHGSGINYAGRLR